MNFETAIKLGLGVAIVGTVAYVVYLVKKKGVQGAAATVAAGVVDAGTGVVLGIGDGISVPRTNLSECERAKQEGRSWDASFACPAGDFLGYLWGSKPAPASWNSGYDLAGH